jgi:hypothetical protein
MVQLRVEDDWKSLASSLQVRSNLKVSKNYLQQTDRSMYQDFFVSF